MSWLEDLLKGALKNLLKDKEILVLLEGVISKWMEKNKPVPVPVPVPTPVPTPVPDPPPVIPDPPPPTSHIYIADMDLIPQRMRDEGGITGRDGILWYALACSCRGNRGWSLENQEISDAYAQEGAIQRWYDEWMENVEQKFRNDPGLRGTILLNDGKDKVGCTLGPAIQARLSAFADRIEMGRLVSEWEY